MLPYGETVTRLRATTVTDPYSGTATRKSWDSPTSLPIEGCAVDASRSIEPLEVGRDSVVTDFVIYAPFGADVLPGDRLVVRGFTCEVVGRPANWRNPYTGAEPGTVIRADIVEG